MERRQQKAGKKEMLLKVMNECPKYLKRKQLNLLLVWEDVSSSSVLLYLD